MSEINPMSKPTVGSGSPHERLTLELKALADDWNLDKCIFLDPIECAEGNSITLFDLLKVLGCQDQKSFDPFSWPWPFLINDFSIEPVGDETPSWSLKATQHANLFQLSNGKDSFILSVFQDKLDHFSALLPLTLLSVKRNILCICIPGWPRRLGHWSGNFPEKLMGLFPQSIDSLDSRCKLEASLVQKNKIVVDTSFPVNHPGNFWMNDIGPAISIHDIAVKSSGTLELARLRSGWLDEKDDTYLITGQSRAVSRLQYFDTKDSISRYAASTDRGLVSLWGASVNPYLSRRCRNLLSTRYSKEISLSAPRDLVIGVGIRAHDRILINLDECIKTIVARFPAVQRKSFRFILHGSVYNPFYRTGSSYHEAELNQAKSLSDTLAQMGISSDICVGQPLFDQLAKLSNATIDISPIGTTQLKSLFMLDIPMIIHSPTGRQAVPHGRNPWHTNGDLSYTSIYRGEPHSACIFTTKDMVIERHAPHVGKKPGRYNYRVDPLQFSCLFMGFYRGLISTDY